MDAGGGSSGVSSSGTSSGGASSSSGSSGGSGSGSTSSSSSGGASSGSSTGGGSSSGGGSCDQQCTTMHPAAFTKFEGYELKECGCSVSAPCAAMCSPADCMATMLSQVSQACQTCLMTEAGKGAASQCTTKAVTNDCSGDATCKPFSDCAICCATNMTPC